MKTKMSKPQSKIKKVMREYKEGSLHMGKKGPGKGLKVKGRKQAIAIAMSEARKAGGRIPKKG